MNGLLFIFVLLFVSVKIPETDWLFEDNKNVVAAIPVNWSDASSKMIFLSTGLYASNCLENTLPEKDEFWINCGSVDAIDGPYGGVEKYIVSSIILKSPFIIVVAAPTVCPAATEPINALVTFKTLVEPTPTELTFRYSLSIWRMSLLKTEPIPEDTYTLVEPIPIDTERPNDIFFLWIGLWIILSIEMITFSFGFLKLNDWVPVVSDVKLNGVFKVVEKPETWKLFVSIFLTNIFDGSLLVPNKVGDK